VRAQIRECQVVWERRLANLRVSAIDFRHRLLPDIIVLPAAVATAVVVTIAMFETLYYVMG